MTTFTADTVYRALPADAKVNILTALADVALLVRHGRALSESGQGLRSALSEKLVALASYAYAERGAAMTENQTQEAYRYTLDLGDDEAVPEEDAELALTLWRIARQRAAALDRDDISFGELEGIICGLAMGISRQKTGMAGRAFDLDKALAGDQGHIAWCLEYYNAEREIGQAIANRLRM